MSAGNILEDLDRPLPAPADRARRARLNAGAGWAAAAAWVGTTLAFAVLRHDGGALALLGYLILVPMTVGLPIAGIFALAHEIFGFQERDDERAVLVVGGACLGVVSTLLVLGALRQAGFFRA